MDNPWVLLLRGLRQAQFQERQENKEQLKDNHVVRVSRPAKRHSARKPAQGHTCGDTHDPTPPSHSNPDSLAFLLVKKIQMIHSSAEISSSGDALSLGQHCSWKSPTHIYADIYRYIHTHICRYIHIYIYTYADMQIFCTS